MNDIYGASSSLLQLHHHRYLEELKEVGTSESKQPAAGSRLRGVGRRVMLALGTILISVGEWLRRQGESTLRQIHVEQT